MDPHQVLEELLVPDGWFKLKGCEAKRLTAV